MTTQGIHGNLLEVTVVSCSKLKDTEWISRQDPYVSIEYGSSKSTTRTCTDGGKNPTFQEKFVFTLIEGLRELNVSVWNSNTVTHDDFIGSGKIPLTKALSQGFDDSSWPLQSKTGRFQNRPLNSQVVADFLQKFNLKKTAVQKALDNLAEGGKITFKEYGKQKIYLARQDQFEIPNTEELNQMKEENGRLQEMLEEQKKSNSQLEGGTLSETVYYIGFEITKPF
ncbi:hypothetical protein HanLR1_Chr16g0612811 [Helianthus annuus]|nr:hypothetical protein HanLR1_Chr16g0612811 [Helianthus annuus]